MKKKNTLWRIPLAVGVAVLAAPPLVQARYDQSSAYEEGRQATRAGHDLSGGEFFTQAERDLVERVRVDLAADRAVMDSAAQITVNANQGAVSLMGTVPNKQLKDHIEERVSQTLGVASVDNRIQIAGAQTGTDADRGAQRQTTERLTRSSQMSSPESMSSSSRPRSLTQAERAGSFPTTGAQGQAAIGERHSTGSGDMHEADRTGSTGPSGSRSFTPGSSGSVDIAARTAKPVGDYAVTTVDRSIAARVRNALGGDPSLFFTPDNAHIKVDNGRVILHGWVNSQQEKDLISARAREIDGVQELDNQLTVTPQAGARRDSQ